MFGTYSLSKSLSDALFSADDLVTLYSNYFTSVLVSFFIGIPFYSIDVLSPIIE